MKNHIQEVLEIERRAQAIHSAAQKKAAKLPVDAQGEANTLLENAQNKAEQEARRLLEKAHAEKETERILGQADEQARQTRSVAMSHFDRAVSYVLDRIAGRE